MNHLREYQREAITDLLTRWDAGATRVPLVLATGLGKTEIFTALESLWINGQGSEVVDTLPARLPLHHAYGLGRRVLVIAHIDELISQAVAKARMRNPHLTIGRVQGREYNEAHAQVVVSSRQTLQSAKRREAIRNVGLIIVDEAHHAVRGNTYGRILEHFGAWNELCSECREANDQVSHDVGREVRGNYCPNIGCATTRACKVAGFTATLARSDKAKLSTVWEEQRDANGIPIPPFRRDIVFGIRHGYLLDVRGERVIVPDLNLGNVRKVAGDFRDDDLAEELERSFAPQVIAKHYAEKARDKNGNLRAGIAFWPLVETAYHGAEAFEDAGIASAVVHGGLPKDERRLILKRFAAGDITVIHNCMVLTEGFDAPNADVVVVARPTGSASLYQQMVGRVLRPDLTVPAELREKALILDVTGAGARHDLRSLVDLSPERQLRADDDGQLSLLELDDLAIQDEARGQEAAVFDDPTAEQWRGDTATVAFDPLHRERVWQRTPDGTFYLSAGTEQYVFLSESWAGEPGTYDVVWCSKLGPCTWPKVDGTQGLTQYVGLPLDEALLCAEDVALERGGHGTKTLTSRKARWRRDVPNDGQLRRARSLGIVVPVVEGCADRMATSTTSAWDKGRVSEEIDAVMAARRIDPLVRAVKAQWKA